KARREDRARRTGEVHEGAAGELQGADVLRVRRRAAAQPDGEGAEDGAAEEVRGGGEFLAVSGQRSAVSGQRSAVSGQRSAVSGQRPAVSGQRPAVSGQRSVEWTASARDQDQMI